MPFHSTAHKQKMADLVKSGKISQKEYDRLDKETGKAKLPERKKPKK